MKAKNWIAIGAFVGATSVLLGAFGAHILKSRIGYEQLEIWHTGTLYQALHAGALVLFGLFRSERGTRDFAGWSFFLGSTIFAGTLYGLALGGPTWLGAITPLGGVGMIAGWIDFAIQALASRD